MLKSITIVTPSFNQASFLPKCLESVRDQTISPLEHLVFDPGSSDNSRDVVRQYPHAKLFAENDEGQSDAVNKGFAKAQGDIVGWLNSDDEYFDGGVFELVIERFNEADRPDLVYGRGIYIDQHGEKLRDAYVNPDPDSFAWRLQKEVGILQPSVFFRRDAIERIGMLRTDLNFCMDYEYWIRCMQAGLKFGFIDANLTRARYYPENKTFGRRDESLSEVCDMLMENFGYVHNQWLERYAEYLTFGHDGVLNASARDASSSNEEYSSVLLQLLKAYNANALVWDRVESRAKEDRACRMTLNKMTELGVQKSTPCREIPIEQTTLDGHVCYTVGEKRWAFLRQWHAEELSRSRNFLLSEIERRESDVCVIVGNGPSLKKVDPEVLTGQDVIVSNYAYLNKEIFDRAKYLTVVNYLVAEQGLQYFNQIETVQKVFPYWLAYCLNASNNTHFVNSVGKAEFSTDMFENMSWRHTVTFLNLHLAYGLGYRKAIMVGFDHYYKQEPAQKEADIIKSGAVDENHFDPKYFQNKKWQAADVDNMEAMYALAKQAFERDGREVVNCTVGGHLELFRRGDLAIELRTP